MNNKIKDKIAKVYELVNKGEQGEKEAAIKALDRLLKKYNLSDKVLETIGLREYCFKYSSKMDMWLFIQLVKFYLPGKEVKLLRNTYGKREIVAELEYLDFVTIETSYEYFKRHMNNQFKKICLPEINRRRKAKTKNKVRDELQDAFFGRYILKSGIYHPEQLVTVNPSKVSDKEYKTAKLISDVEGGKYNEQVTTGLYLEN